MTLESPLLSVFFSLPLAGRVGERKRSRGGGSNDTPSAAALLMTLTPPPDRRFATATLPALASLAGEG